MCNRLLPALVSAVMLTRAAQVTTFTSSIKKSSGKLRTLNEFGLED